MRGPDLPRRFHRSYSRYRIVSAPRSFQKAGWSNFILAPNFIIFDDGIVAMARHAWICHNVISRPVSWNVDFDASHFLFSHTFILLVWPRPQRAISLSSIGRNALVSVKLRIPCTHLCSRFIIRYLHRAQWARFLCHIAFGENISFISLVSSRLSGNTDASA
jgi:hypothetical protein